jgi:hypothetical protein
LVGVHPVLTQVPPKSLRSMIATCQPAPTNRRAKAGPACPVPMMIAWYSSMATSGDAVWVDQVHRIG